MIDKDIWDKYTKIERFDFNLYKGKDRRNNQYVIINEYRKNSKVLNRFREMRKESLSQSNNINKILEIIETKEYFYIVEELWTFTLEEVFKKHQEEIVSIDKIQEIFLQINNVLKIFIDNGIVMGEVSLSRIVINNSFLSNKLNIKISLPILINYCFPLDEDDDITYIPPTVSPEVMFGEHVTYKSDIWSLGIILYLLCFKEYPYKGKNEVTLLKDIRSNKKLKMPDDEDLADLLKKMLTVNINERISWNDYFNHPFFKKNFSEDNNLSDKNSILNKMSFQINKLYDNLNFEIVKLGYETKIKQYEEKITKLEEENKNDKNKIKLLEAEIQKDKEKINQIEKNYNEVNKNLINISKNYKDLKRKYEGK